MPKTNKSIVHTHDHPGYKERFYLGHVERVFPSEEEMAWYAGNTDVDEKSASQFILVKPLSGLLPTLRNEFYARPLLRGYSDSITRGDLVLWTNINDKNFYLGPLNTQNSPNYSPDHTYKPPKKTRGTGKDGYSVMFPTSPTQEKIKKKSSILDRFGRDLEEYSELDLISKFTDMTIEGRHGNSIRLGSRREEPQIIISNKRWGSVESKLDGSNISMLSIGSLMQNLYGYGQIEGGWHKLSCDSVDIKNPREIHINYGNDPLPSEMGLYEDKFDYDYGNPLITHEDRQVYTDQKRNQNQMILFSDRIVFDAREWDLTFSAKRNINFGAGKNFTISNKGFSVIESNNIYLGKEAKNRTEPMVLGNKLKDLLIKIMEILRDSRALVQGVPIPLVKQDSSPMLIEIEKVLSDLNNEFSPEVNTENAQKPIPIGDRSKGGPSFFSHYHFIESNVRPKPTQE